ncbi:thioredoxin domain-containing protein 17-like [Acipenser oxyrinchus oxyrinchus]|uniref:Thioredoxin domain-containing protein 17 n=1 Tax=Acipenser oxyrinchus oxyrinchus TaxID=40147 RepID=A0AAD8CW90_ACIOX|nr:thioredoxin domain-containing protein 17-like [Acipenser oxyrinchus oxyrinchus]
MARQYEEVTVRGYDEFMKAVSQRKGKDVFAYFSGSKNEQGVSWCPDCVKAEPIVRGELGYLPPGSVFIYCQVGERPYWKDPNNEFKKTLKLSGVPTLLRYGTPQKLVEEECFKKDLVRMMFTED